MPSKACSWNNRIMSRVSSFETEQLIYIRPSKMRRFIAGPDKHKLFCSGYLPSIITTCLDLPSWVRSLGRFYVVPVYTRIALHIRAGWRNCALHLWIVGLLIDETLVTFIILNSFGRSTDFLAIQITQSCLRLQLSISALRLMERCLKCWQWCKIDGHINTQLHDPWSYPHFLSISQYHLNYRLGNCVERRASIENK